MRLDKNRARALLLLLLVGLQVVLPAFPKTNMPGPPARNAPGTPIASPAPDTAAVIVTFDRFVTAADLATFQSLGGEVTDGPWSVVVRGFAGTLPGSQVAALTEAMPDARVEFDAKVTTSLNALATQVGARPVAWDDWNVTGASNASVALFDSGIEASHHAFDGGYGDSDFSKPIVGWNDFVGSQPLPYDDEGHGTFVSGVVASQGTKNLGGAFGQLVHARVERNFSHLELFPDGLFMGQHSVKVATFKVAFPPVGPLELSVSFTQQVDRGSTNNVGFILVRNNTFGGLQTVNFTTNDVEGVNYTLVDATPQLGWYDVYFNYSVGLDTNVTFSATVDFWWPGDYSQLVDDHANFKGIAPDSKLVVAKVVDDAGRGNVSKVISALDWLVLNRENYRVAVACLSLEDEAPTNFQGAALASALNATIEAGIMVVVAAGNGGLSVNGKSPLNKLALDERVIVVGATNGADQVASYSAQGRPFNSTGAVKPDLVAPGGSLTGLQPTVFGPTTLNANDTTAGVGTSISAAVVAATLNMMVQVSGNWSSWNSGVSEKKVRDFKALLLMTCTETLQNREDDPLTTDVNEGLAANSPTFDAGGKDVHEGFGRLNVQAALEALNTTWDNTTLWEGSLAASTVDPAGKHASARRVVLEQYQPYSFTVTHPAGANFQLYLYQNYSTPSGDPILEGTSVVSGAGQQVLYFTATNETREYVVVLKAVAGSGSFSVNLTRMDNYNAPVLSDLVLTSSSPLSNDTFDTWTLTVTYADADNNQPVYVRVNVTRTSGGYSENFSMLALNPFDVNFTDGADYIVAFELELTGNYTFYVEASDGLRLGSTKAQTWWSSWIIVNAPRATSFPYVANFGLPIQPINWTHEPNDGWVFHPSFDAWHVSDYEDDEWSYQNLLSATLYSPLVFLGSASNPWLQVGLRVSVSSAGDQLFVQLNVNKTGWTTLETYAGPTVNDWFAFTTDLSEYSNSYVQVRFWFISDYVTDYVRNRGVMINDFRIVERVNDHAPQFKEPEDGYFSPDQGNRYDEFDVRVYYFDEDDNPPEFVQVRIGGATYVLYNLEGDWDFNSGDGVLYGSKVVLESSGVTELTFLASDGNGTVESEPLQGPNVKNQLTWREFPYYAYLNVTPASEFRVAGTPVQYAEHEWLETRTSWNQIAKNTREDSYFYCAEITENTEFGFYGENWNASLVMPTVYVDSPHEVILSFRHQIYVDQVAGDAGYVEVSTDQGDTWDVVAQFLNTNQTGQYNWEFFHVDLTDYNEHNLTVRFRFVSDGYTQPGTSAGMGWKVGNISLAAFLELDPPAIRLNSPALNQTLKGTVRLNFTVSDASGVDWDRLFLFINDEPQVPVVDNGTVLFTWNTADFPNGPAKVRLVVEDSLGNQGIFDATFQLSNPKVDWAEVGFWALILGVVAACAALVGRFAYKRVTKRIRALESERDRLLDAHGLIPSEQTRVTRLDALLEKLTPELEGEMPFTLYCKRCHQWFKADEFFWVCPRCDTDTLFVAKKCLVCDKWYFLDGPGTYYCTTGRCNRKLVRDPEAFDEMIASGRLDQPPSGEHEREERNGGEDLL